MLYKDPIYYDPIESFVVLEYCNPLPEITRVRTTPSGGSNHR